MTPEKIQTFIDHLERENATLRQENVALKAENASLKAENVSLKDNSLQRRADLLDPGLLV